MDCLDDVHVISSSIDACSLSLPPPTPQASVPDWLTLLNLSQYEQVMMDAGYDDIDFVTDISGEELQDVGITKKGELVCLRCLCQIL